MDDRELREKLNRLYENHAHTMALIQSGMTEEQLAQLRAHQERAEERTKAEQRIEKLAEIVVAVIDHQLTLADQSADALKYQRWPIGYCFGALDAVARHYGLDWNTEGIALVTEGWAQIISRREGEKYARRCLELQADRFFAEGREHGGDDFHQWLVSNGDFRPLTLLNFFAFGKPAPLRELR